MRAPIMVAAALLATACNQNSDPAIEQMKQKVLMTLREHRTAEFADIRRCGQGDGYTGTVTAGNGNGGRSGPVPFIVIGDLVALNEDATPADQRILAGSYQMGRYAILQPRCFGESDAAYRARYRSQAMDMCRQGVASTPDGAILDAEQLCTCMVDSYMRDSSSEQLRAEKNLPAGPARADAVWARCAQEAAQRAGAPPRSNAQ